MNSSGKATCALAPIPPGRLALELIFEELFGHWQVGLRSRPLLRQLLPGMVRNVVLVELQEEAANSVG